MAPQAILLVFWNCKLSFAGIAPAMAERMNQDLVFDHKDAVSDFGYKPRPFKLLKDDLLIK